MRRAIASVLALVLAAALALPAQAAMRDEPKDFRGIPFGKRFNPGNTFACEVDSEEGLRCTRASDDKHLCGVPLKSLSYLFMYHYLFTVDMEVDGQEGFDKVVQELTARHGKPVPQSGGTSMISGKNVDIMLYYDATRHTGEIGYVFKNLPCPVE